MSIRIVVSGLAALVCASVAVAGDTDPPAGAISSTMKTLDEVEARLPLDVVRYPGDADSVIRITAGGSYYLTGDVVGEVGKHGIEVFTGDPVVIDLNGYALVGITGSLNGITSVARTDVRNGVVRQWGGDGISAASGIVEHVTVFFNGGHGIALSWGSVVTECVAEGNGGNGISLGDVSNVTDCVSKINTGWGIHVDGACTVTGCTVYANSAGGIDAFISTVSGCLLFSNSVASINDRGLSVITGNNIRSGGTGILASGDGSRIESNTVSGCVTGYDVDGADNLVVSNMSQGNTTGFDIVAGNKVGTVQAGPAGAGAWDNFEF